MGKITKLLLLVFAVFTFTGSMAQDTTPPMAVCQNATVQLDATGMATITVADLDNGSTDNVGIVTSSLDITSFDCTNLGANPVMLTVEDAAGNSDTCMATVTVQDTMAPMAICQAATVTLDAMGNGTLTAAMIDGGSTDNCTGFTLTASQTAFTCSDIGAVMVTLTVEDSAGNTNTCISTVTVEDTTPPTIVCQDATVQLDATGNITINPAIFDNGSSDNCGAGITFSVSQTVFDCTDVLNVPPTDLLISGIVAGRYVDEMTDPTPDIITTYEIIELYAVQDIPDLSIYSIGVANDGNGTDGSEIALPAIMLAANTHFTIASEAVNSALFLGAAPNYVDAGLDIDGDDAVELYLSGAIIDVVGEYSISTDPMVTDPWDYTEGWGYRIANTLANATFQQDDWFFSTPGALDDDETNAGALVPFPQGNYVQILGGVSAPVTVTFTVTDASGNMNSCMVNLTIEDVTAPTSLPQDITLQLDANGEVFLDVDVFDNGSSDSCGLATRIAEPSAFFCDEVGMNTVTLTVTDTFGNETVNTAIVTIEDNIVPVMGGQDITVQLDAAGAVTITSDQVIGSTSDVCGLNGTLTTINIDTFTCSDIGVNPVVLSVTDVNGNSNSSIVMVTVEDTVAPTAICQNITVQLDATGNVNITAADIDNMSTDACGVMSRVLDITSFTCADIGNNNVVMTVTDNEGNEATCTAVVTVQDMVAPIAVAMDITIGIGTSGSTTIVGSQVDNGSSDNCSIASFTVVPDTFSCAEIGAPVPVVLTVTDTEGNMSTATANVTLVDNVPPSAVCKNITLPLDATGNASITVADIDDGSSVACGGIVTTISTTSFDCSNIGANSVTLTVTNSNNVSSSCTAIVTVVDTALPVVACQDITLVLDGTGMATLTAADIDNGITDNCGIATSSIDITSFDCDDVGTNNVVLTVTDVNGNQASCTAIVTVVDDVGPMAVCQNINVQLDASGNASIDALDVDGGSSDFCGITSRSIDVSSFDCDDLGPNTVVLTVMDASGNVASCNAVVTVEDMLPPTVMCQNITVQLDASGNASIVAADVDNGSTDGCGIASINIDNGLFNCNNIGANTVNLTVTDSSGNSSSCAAIVTVEDNEAPTVVCQNITVQLDASGTAFINVSDIDGGSSDACGVQTTSLDITTFNCDDIGDNGVTLTVTDVNGNIATCVATVTVQDVEDPVIDCPDSLNVVVEPGALYTVPDLLSDGSVTANDNCSSPLTDTTQDPAVGTQLAEGTYPVSITVTDDSGNSESCFFNIIVSDTALGLEGAVTFSSIKMYPNPATSYVILENTELIDIDSASFYDLAGRLVKKFYIQSSLQETSIEISAFSTGTYMVIVQGPQGKLIKQLIKK